MTLANNYIFKALDAYPYDLEEAIEALNYALSYDENNVEALCLMGRIYAENLKDYETAKQVFTDALQVNVKAFSVYPHYINVLLWNEDFNEVEKFIEFALTIKGSNKGNLYLKKAILFEIKGEYKKALEFIKLAKMNTYNSDFMYTINEVKYRIKEKIPKKKSKKSKKTKKNKK